jgi:hypothetical protein
MQKILKMLVHHINHPVAQRPQKKEGANQSKNPQMIPSVSPLEKPPCGFGFLHVHIWLA